MAEIKYEIVERIAVLGERPRGWERQLNLISWNEGEPKYDILSLIHICEVGFRPLKLSGQRVQRGGIPGVAGRFGFSRRWAGPNRPRSSASS